MNLKERFAEYNGFLDVGILRHGFAPHMRDYDVLFEAMWGVKQWGDAKGTYLLRFSHCPRASVTTALSDAGWKEAWADTFIDFRQWIAAGEPAGFVWAACWSTAYPGFSYVEDSADAKAWARRLDKEMHEVRLITEAFEVRIIFHDFTVTKVSDEVGVIDKVMFPLSPQGEKTSE